MIESFFIAAEKNSFRKIYGTIDVRILLYFVSVFLFHGEFCYPESQGNVMCV